MQVLDRQGEEDRDKREASPDAGAATFAQPVPEENIIADDELEIRASHITAAAVAAASVTAAVVTEAAAAAKPSSIPVARRQTQALPEPVVGHQAFPAAVPLPQPEVQAQPRGESTAAAQAEPHGAAGSPRAAWPISLLTLLVIGLALWWSSQASWPQRALKPMVQELPSLRKPAAVAAAAPAAPVVIDEPAAAQAPGRDEIAILQAEAEDKARLLAQQRAATDARHRREDAAQALREQRRRDAEAQLAAARAKAERAQGVVPEPEVVEVAPAPSLADRVQQCSALSLFSRESCLWKLCNGKWGKDGCPSYERSAGGA